MAIKTKIKDIINTVLRLANLRISTFASEEIEIDRIKRQKAIGQFNKPIFPLLKGMESLDTTYLEECYSACRNQIDSLMRGASLANFDCANTFYSTPDAEILYLMVRSLSPKRIIEVGSGNSTRIIRQAIWDGKITVDHLAIDPEPRADINGFANRMIYQRFEEADISHELTQLRTNDILFVDSSHVVRVANDVVKLFCNVIPLLSSGVVVHLHDIFLPFDYPEPFCTRYSHWGEQYLLQVLLANSSHEILWPGYYVQRLRPDLHGRLPFVSRGRAQSLWFRV